MKKAARGSLKTYWLRAESQQEMESWIVAIQQSLGQKPSFRILRPTIVMSPTDASPPPPPAPSSDAPPTPTSPTSEDGPPPPPPPLSATISTSTGGTTTSSAAPTRYHSTTQPPRSTVTAYVLRKALFYCLIYRRFGRRMTDGFSDFLFLFLRWFIFSGRMGVRAGRVKSRSLNAVRRLHTRGGRAARTKTASLYVRSTPLRGARRGAKSVAGRWGRGVSAGRAPSAVDRYITEMCPIFSFYFFPDFFGRGAPSDPPHVHTPTHKHTDRSKNRTTTGREFALNPALSLSILKSYGSHYAASRGRPPALLSSLPSETMTLRRPKPRSQTQRHQSTHPCSLTNFQNLKNGPTTTPMGVNIKTHLCTSPRATAQRHWSSGF